MTTFNYIILNTTVHFTLILVVGEWRRFLICAALADLIQNLPLIVRLSSGASSGNSS